jgi:DNA-binding CsgD family transcriptional regulator
LKYQVTTTDNLDSINQIHIKKKCNAVIINPSFVQNNNKLFVATKARCGNVIWIALIYAQYEKKILSLFDESISIFDDPSEIDEKISGLINSENFINNSQLPDILSERETDVLIQLASGKSNREIAEKLHISINTVMTHRKNISQKTGIKTVSGLTIYAVVKKIISL